MTIFSKPVGLWLLAVGVVATACKKEPIQYTFQGVVRESVDHAVMSGAEVVISQRTYNGSVASAYFNSVGSMTTGSDGMYDLTFDREKVFEFKIQVTKEGYYDVEEIIGSADVSTDVPKVGIHVMEPKSWINFHLKNIDGLPEDEFVMIHYNFRTDCSGCTTNEFHYYDGVVDSNFTISSTGGVYARYSYKTPSGSVYIQDSVYMTPFDSVAVTINY